MKGPCNTPELGPDAAEHAAEILKALAHPIRLRLLTRLLRQEDYVSRLARELSVSQPVISQQLGVLKSHGLVRSETRDGYAWSSVCEPHLGSMLDCICRCMASRRGGKA